MLWNYIGIYITDLGETCKGSGARNPDSIGGDELQKSP